MPYQNMPEALWGKMHDCVKQVMADGKDEESAIKICYDSLMKEAKAESAKEHSFLVLKQADGQYRWVAISSNSYQDRDGEIVAQKALEADCDRADADKQYGPLRWWHVGLPDPVTKSAGPGFDIGDCDFNAMHGRMLVESGTFRHAHVAKALAEHASELELSSGFFHPLTEPDDQGVYQHVRRFERSLLPAGNAANSFTSFVAQEVTMATLQEKLKAFLDKLGGDAQLAEQVMQTAEQMEQKAKEQGVAFKEQPAPEAVTTKPADAPAEGDTPPDAGTMPAMDELAAKVAALVLEQLAPIIEGLKAQQEKSGTATKEANDKLASQLAQVAKAQAVLETRLKELEGLQPRGYRASQDPDTAAGATVKDKKPGPDSKDNGFLQFVLGTPIPPAS